MQPFDASPVVSIDVSAAHIRTSCVWMRNSFVNIVHDGINSIEIRDSITSTFDGVTQIRFLLSFSR